ncbi:hypothetical protein [Denitromonas iodatirespirans]|uniref:AsmA family protein n=1 Tax=Denitromonas iodatirespirans TaxID=2795389 RepID=A0A944HA07_DENI1|nr:hypothetical protein [Denitromonas iodatirespirans]MBT0960082.1 hypothetical protein [Denitromonas iodatirespirans]
MTVPKRPRRRSLRILLLVAGVLLVCVVTLWQFADRWLAQTLAVQVNAHVAGHLRIDGPVSLQVFPPRLALADVSWRGPGETPSRLQIDHLAMASDWTGKDGTRPLSVDLDGVRGQLRQQADGRWQVPAPAGETAGSGMPLRLARLDLSDMRMALLGHGTPPATLRVERAQVTESPGSWQATVDGGAAQADTQLDGRLTATLQTTPTGPQLADVTAHLAGAVGATRIDRLTLTLASARQTPDGAFRADGLAAELQAQQGTQQLRLSTRAATAAHADARSELLGTHIQATLTPAGPAESATATLDGADLQLAAGHLTATGTLQLATTLPAGPVDLAADAMQLTADLAARRVEARSPSLHVHLPDPAKPGAQLRLDAEMAGHWDMDARRGAGTVSAQVERSRLDGQWHVDLDNARWLAVQARVDRLNLDRWRPPSRPSSEPLPLDAWRDWPVQLDLQVGRLRMEGIDARDTRLRINTSP